VFRLCHVTLLLLLLLLLLVTVHMSMVASPRISLDDQIFMPQWDVQILIFERKRASVRLFLLYSLS
jgi:hypothetical protein